VSDERDRSERPRTRSWSPTTARRKGWRGRVRGSGGGPARRRIRIVHVVPGWTPVGPLTPGTDRALQGPAPRCSRRRAGSWTTSLRTSTSAPCWSVGARASRGSWRPSAPRPCWSSGVARESGLDRIWRRGGTLDGVASGPRARSWVVPRAWTPSAQGETVLAGVQVATPRSRPVRGSLRSSGRCGAAGRGACTPGSSRASTTTSWPGIRTRGSGASARRRSSMTRSLRGGSRSRRFRCE
jgi:hypothetical protein